MPRPDNNRSLVDNRLLAALPADEYQRLRPNLELVSLQFRQVLSRPGQLLPHVYFPTSGIISLLAVLPDGSTAEVAMVGREGMAGIAAFLADGQALLKMLVQAPGEALRMRAVAFRDVVQGPGPLHDVLLLYSQALLTLTCQSIACNLLHPAEIRLRRWLLMTHDRIESDQFRLTQAFIADMLGVNRSTVSLVAGAIQRAGHIRYRRGQITIVDRPGLEATSCPCYGMVQKEFQRLLG